MLEAAVSVPGHRDRYYLIDPQGGSLTVSSLGGDGGKGGKGGRGGHGGSGGIGQPSGSNGRDGNSGHDGMDGSSGRGGPVTITYDPAVQPYLKVIQVRNPGGPKPVLQEHPVGPLW